MRYVILLRGINVGGNGKVSMKELKSSLEQSGFNQVMTYINSGNVLVTSELSTDKVNSLVEDVIQRTFGLAVYALTLTKADFQRIAHELPIDWTNDHDKRTDCLFLWNDIDTADVLNRLTVKPEIDHVKYIPGVVFWHVARKNVTKSGLAKIIGTDIYKKITIRNANTLRKLTTLLDV